MIKKYFIFLSIFLILFSFKAYAGKIDVDEDDNDCVDIGYGGTNSDTAAGARTNLSLVPGTNIIAVGGSLAGCTGLSADTGLTGLTTGDNYTNFGDSGDDTIDELFEAIDDSWAGGGGSAIVVDLGDDEGDDTSDLDEIAPINDTNSIFSVSGDKLTIDMSNNWPTADTANEGDSATAFFSSGTIEDARIASTIARDSEITATKLDDLSIPDDNTDLNASSSYHGLLPKLSNNSSEYLNGAGNWATPSGSGDVTSVGDCTDGACLDGSSDGGQYIRLYDGDSNYVQIDVGDLSGDITINLPTSSMTLVGTSDITFENLNSNSDVGTGADQVAAGDHNHSGVYEPADSDIAKINEGENISGTWEIQDDINLNFGNDADIGIRYDETTDDQLEIHSNNASATTVSFENAGAGAMDVSIGGVLTINAEGTSTEFPTDRGSNGQVLGTDGAGNADWINAGTGDMSASTYDTDSSGVVDDFDLEDDITGTFGSAPDWYIEYAESDEDTLSIYTAKTTSSGTDNGMMTISVDTGNSGCTANQEVFEIGKGAQDDGDANFTELLALDEDGDFTVAGSIVSGSVDGQNAITLYNNSSIFPSGHQIYVEANEFKISENGNEEVLVTEEDSATFSGNTVSFVGVTNLILPITADASGEIGIDTTNHQLQWHDGATAITIDMDTDAVGYVLKSDGAGNYTPQADATGGTPTWDTVGDPVADVTIDHDIGEETNFTYTGNYTTGSQFLIEQLTGNPTGGVLFEVKAADSDTIVTQFGDGTNIWAISTAGQLYNSGTATINFAAASDLLIAGAQIDYDDLSGTADAANVASVIKTDGASISIGDWSSTISTGAYYSKAFQIPFKATLTSVTLSTNQVSGDITIDIWIDALSATTGLANITDTDSLFDVQSEPAIADASSDNTVTVTSFDSGEDAITAEDVIVVNVDSVTTLTGVNVMFVFERTD